MIILAIMNILGHILSFTIKAHFYLEPSISFEPLLHVSIINSIK